MSIRDVVSSCSCRCGMGAGLGSWGLLLSIWLLQTLRKGCAAEKPRSSGPCSDSCALVSQVLERFCATWHFEKRLHLLP